jgi:hypothetical protein
VKSIFVIIASVVFFFGYVCVATANDWRNLNTLAERSGFDDTIHFAVGAGIAYLIKQHSGLTGWKLRATMIAVPLALGLLKETTDKNFDSGDVLGYGVGATGVVLFTF